MSLTYKNGDLVRVHFGPYGEIEGEGYLAIVDDSFATDWTEAGTEWFVS